MSNEVRLILGAATDVGSVRDVNEDAHGFVRCSLGDLLLVCDGMGGHAAGDVASRTARDAILLHALTSRAHDERTLLREALVAGHLAVRAVAEAAPGRQGMGTTVVAALIRDRWVWIGNVGDSRAYLVRGQRASMLSKDHTKAQKLLDGGLISAEQAETHPEKSVLSQALGQRMEPEPAISERLELGLDDALVLCSDGVYESMHERLGAVVGGANNPNYGAHDLVADAVREDGKDNATAIVARWVDLSSSRGVLRPPPAQRAEAGPVGRPAWRQRRWWGGAAAGAGLLGIGLLVGRCSQPEPALPADCGRGERLGESDGKRRPDDGTGDETASPSLEEHRDRSSQGEARSDPAATGAGAASGAPSRASGRKPGGQNRAASRPTPTSISSPRDKDTGKTSYSDAGARPSENQNGSPKATSQDGSPEKPSTPASQNPTPNSPNSDTDTLTGVEASNDKPQRPQVDAGSDLN